MVVIVDVEGGQIDKSPRTDRCQTIARKNRSGCCLPAWGWSHSGDFGDFGDLDEFDDLDGLEAFGKVWICSDCGVYSDDLCWNSKT